VETAEVNRAPTIGGNFSILEDSVGLAPAIREREGVEAGGIGGYRGEGDEEGEGEGDDGDDEGEDEVEGDVNEVETEADVLAREVELAAKF
jgi:hypothetical protein